MKSSIQQVMRSCLIWVIPCLTMVGCAHFAKAPADAPQVEPVVQAPPAQVETTPVETEKALEPDHFVHTVRWHGETLSFIAKWYTGRYRNWRVLAKANPNINPNRIFTGNKIIIPEAALKTRKSLPKEFLSLLSPKPKKTKTISKTSPKPKEGDGLPLFGPKEYSSQ